MLEKNNTQRVMELFFTFPTSKFSIREIARRLKITPPTTSYIVKRLAKEGYLKIDVTDVASFVSANNENKNFIIRKRIYNIGNIYESGIIDIIKDNIFSTCLLLFGSYSRGEDIEPSDVDIAIFFKGRLNSKNAEKIEKEKKTAETILGRKVQLHFIGNFDKKSSIKKELINNIANGIVIDGYLGLL